MSAISPVVQQMRGPLEMTPLETAQQNKAGHLTSGKDTARAMRDSLTGENSLEVSAGNDSVTISEEGRAMRQRMAADKESGHKNGSDGETTPGAKESVHTGLAGAVEGEEKSAAEQAIENIKKQIEQVKEKLDAAKQRLAAATATSGGAGGIAVSGESGSAEQAAAMAQSMGNAMTQNAEAEGIQAEIKMLGQQLQMLYQQLQEATQNGSGAAGGMGTAGIGGAADGPSGQGERIAVSA